MKKYGETMKRFFLLIFFLSGCSPFIAPSQQISYWKPLLTDLDDIVIVRLSSSPIGPFWRNEAVFKSDKEDDALPFYEYLFGDHFKERSKKGFQTWKYIIYFHKSENNFKEHRIRISEKGISYEGIFYPFQSEKDQEELFQLLEEKLK